MATHAPTTGAPAGAHHILSPAELSCLGGTVHTVAEYVDAIAEHVDNQIHAIRGFMRDPEFRGMNFAEVGEWRTISTFLSLLRDQARDLIKVGERIEEAKIAEGR